VISYAFLYSFDSEVQGWYIANFAVPAAILSGSGLSYLAHRWSKLTYSFALLMCGAGLFLSLKPTMPYQEVMYRAGIYLHYHPEIRRVGSFNAGIIGFFAHNGVTNLDGLVNDSILPYAKTGRLAQYIVDRKIDYILDSPQIFWAYYPLRGGYADGRLQRCIKSTADLFPDDPDNTYAGDRIRLYRLDMICLKSTGQD
jgi:hypothetical protein